MAEGHLELLSRQAGKVALRQYYGRAQQAESERSRHPVGEPELHRRAYAQAPAEVGEQRRQGRIRGRPGRAPEPASAPELVRQPEGSERGAQERRGGCGRRARGNRPGRTGGLDHAAVRARFGGSSGRRSRRRRIRREHRRRQQRELEGRDPHQCHQELEPRRPPEAAPQGRRQPG